MYITYIHNTNQSEVAITVDYYYDVEIYEIVKVVAFNSITKDFVDITEFAINKLNLDEYIGGITDWYALYNQELQLKKEK